MAASTQDTKKRLSEYTRLFIIGDRNTTEEEVRTGFEKYGKIKNISFVRQPHSDEHKGFMYVTYEKPSEAALAIEEMNGKSLASHTRKLKVLLSSREKAGQGRGREDDEVLDRLFLVIPKSHTEEDVRDVFQEWGDLDYVRILRDRNTKKSKGLCFIRYYRAYCAAKAFEECDQSYKAVFATRKGAEAAKRSEHDSRYDGPMQSMGYDGPRQGMGYDGPRQGMGYDGPRQNMGFDGPRQGMGFDGPRQGMGFDGPLPSVGFGNMSQQSPARDPFTDLWIPKNMAADASTDLEILVSPKISVDNIRKIFDVIPGMISCDINSLTGVGQVKYSHVELAEYARQKLDGLEYPAGFRMSVKVSGRGFGSASSSGSAGVMQIAQSLAQAAMSAENMQTGDMASNLQNLLQNIQKAASAVQGMATSGPQSSPTMHHQHSDAVFPVKYCNIPLPQVKPLMSRDAQCAKKLFFVSKPKGFTEDVLHDCFCRFGNLIDAFFMPGGKNYGYVKYGSEESAIKAMDTLNEAEVCGMLIKVVEADLKRPVDENMPKRQRTHAMESD